MTNYVNVVVYMRDTLSISDCVCHIADGKGCISVMYNKAESMKNGNAHVFDVVYDKDVCENTTNIEGNSMSIINLNNIECTIETKEYNVEGNTYELCFEEVIDFSNMDVLGPIIKELNVYLGKEDVCAYLGKGKELLVITCNMEHDFTEEEQHIPTVGTWLVCDDMDTIKEVNNFDDAWAYCYITCCTSAKLYSNGVLWLDETELLAAYPRGNKLAFKDWMIHLTDAEIAMVLFDRIVKPEFNTIPF